MIIKLSNCLIPECRERGVTDHKWEFERPTMREFRRIQEVADLDPDEFGQGLASGFSKLGVQAIDAVLVLVDILHRRDGIKAAFEDVDFDPADFEFIHEVPDEPEPEGKEAEAVTISPHLEDAALTSSTSGPSSEEGSPPKSGPTPPTSGAATASP